MLYQDEIIELLFNCVYIIPAVIDTGFVARFPFGCQKQTSS